MFVDLHYNHEIEGISNLSSEETHSRIPGKTNIVYGSKLSFYYQIIILFIIILVPGDTEKQASSHCRTYIVQGQTKSKQTYKEAK